MQQADAGVEQQGRRDGVIAADADCVRGDRAGNAIERERQSIVVGRRRPRARPIAGQLKRRADLVVQLDRRDVGHARVAEGREVVVQEAGSVIRQRNHVLDLQCHRILLGQRNLVADEGIAHAHAVHRPCGGGIEDLVLEDRASERIAIRSRGGTHVASARRHRAAEIASAVGGRRNIDRRGAIDEGFAILLVVEEEEALVVPVVDLGQLYGTAGRETPIVASRAVAYQATLAIVGEGLTGVERLVHKVIVG